MMVGIVSIGPGIVPLAGFQPAADPASGVIAFCAGVDDPALFHGFDTGWSVIPDADTGYVWAWDFGTAALVQLYRPSLDYRLASQVVGIDPKTTTSTAWEAVGGVVLTPSMHGDLATVLAALTCETLVSGIAELRVTETDSLGAVVDMLPVPLPLTDTAGGYVTRSLATTVSPSAGQNTYRVEARVATVGDSISVRFVTMALAVVG